jgi:hypothetical protein
MKRGFKMKRKNIWFSLLIVFVAIVSFMIPVLTVSAESGIANNTPQGEIVNNYLSDITNHKWESAYLMTSRKFQEKIPIEAFIHNNTLSGFAYNIVEYQISETVTETNLSTVEVILEYKEFTDKPSIRKPYKFTLTKEDLDWFIDLPCNEYLPSKLETQSPIAICQVNDVSIAVQYLLLYHETLSKNYKCRVRLDISNESSQTLIWNLPLPGSTDSYIKDNNTKNMYYVIAGCGASGKIGEEFELIKEGTNYVLKAAPHTQGSVFVYFGNVPDNLYYFDMNLSGFTFQNSRENWGALIQNAPFIIDIAP